MACINLQQGANKKCIEFHQGETLNLPIGVKIGDKVVTKDDISEIEFAFDPVHKKYTRETAKFENDAFIVSLSAEDTASIPYNRVRHFQIKVVFGDGSIKFTKCYPFSVLHTHFSKEEFENGR